MKTACRALVCLVYGLAAAVPVLSQEPSRAPACPAINCPKVPASGLPSGSNGFHWTHGCFPRCGCPD